MSRYKVKITEDMKQGPVMDRIKVILQLAEQMGIIRPRDLKSMGIPNVYLQRLVKKGALVCVGRGLYALPGSLTSESVTIAGVAKLVPHAVVCLITALQFHHLTTQVSPNVWIAIENKKWEPTVDYPPIEIVRFTGKAFSYQAEEHLVDRIPVKVYSPAKTVADCFKFRNKIGLDVAIEALRDTWRNRAATMDQLWEAAKICRVANVMRPYLEAVTA
jgi:predicted transcriptional regulator of viral defense system